MDGAAEHPGLPIPVRLRVADVTWSIHVRNLATGETFELDPDMVLSMASVGKILLLAEVAFRIEEGRLPADELVHRTDADAVADSGLWQHLDVRSLTVRDAAVSGSKRWTRPRVRWGSKTCDSTITCEMSDVQLIRRGSRVDLRESLQRYSGASPPESFVRLRCHGCSSTGSG